MRYFNRTRGPVAVMLKTGESTIVRPKGTLVVTPEQDGSASLHAKVRKKIFVRLEDKPVAAPVPVPPSEEVPPVVEEELAEEPEEEGSEDDEFEDDDLEGVPSMQWTKAQLIEYANSLDLDVSSNSTKVEILQAIEEAGR